MSKLTPTDIERAIAWREEGKSCPWIGRKLGVSAGAINYQCLKAGAVSPRQTGRSTYHGRDQKVGRDGRVQRRFSPDDDAQLLALALEGLPGTVIAARMGRARTSVMMRLMLLGQHEEIAA